MGSKDNTFIVNDPSQIPAPLAAGAGNTVVTTADANGSVIFNRGGLAVGRGATADATSIAIGADAGAGVDANLIALHRVFAEQGDADALQALSLLVEQHRAQQRDPHAIESAWRLVKRAAEVHGVWQLAAAVGALFGLG